MERRQDSRKIGKEACKKTRQQEDRKEGMERRQDSRKIGKETWEEDKTAGR